MTAPLLIAHPSSASNSPCPETKAEAAKGILAVGCCYKKASPASSKHVIKLAGSEAHVDDQVRMGNFLLINPTLITKVPMLPSVKCHRLVRRLSRIHSAGCGG